jgi:DNA-3-methyladenine glycosylase
MVARVARATEVRGAGERRLPASHPLSSEWLGGDVREAASNLLGAVLVSTVGGVTTSGRIVEVEAYGGPEDPASHAAVRAGRTPRNDAMFGPAGTAYVYRSYGMHWCVNVVSGREGEAAAVLVRALEPLEGEEAMASRRGGSSLLTSGPGRLCQSLGITGGLNGHSLVRAPLRLMEGTRVPPSSIGVSGRIGVRAAADWPRRFYVRGSPNLSRPSH